MDIRIINTLVYGMGLSFLLDAITSFTPSINKIINEHAFSFSGVCFVVGGLIAYKDVWYAKKNN